MYVCMHACMHACMYVCIPIVVGKRPWNQYPGPSRSHQDPNSTAAPDKSGTPHLHGSRCRNRLQQSLGNVGLPTPPPGCGAWCCSVANVCKCCNRVTAPWTGNTPLYVGVIPTTPNSSHLPELFFTPGPWLLNQNPPSSVVITCHDALNQLTWMAPCPHLGKEMKPGPLAVPFRSAKSPSFWESIWLEHSVAPFLHRKKPYIFIFDFESYDGFSLLEARKTRS